MSEQEPLFRVVGPDGRNHYGFSIDCDGTIEGYCSADDMSGWSVEWLRDPRPIAAEVHAVVEAAERWARCPGLQAADKLRDAVRTLAAKEGENG